jgi:hypothetical protein
VHSDHDTDFLITLYATAKASKLTFPNEPTLVLKLGRRKNFKGLTMHLLPKNKGPTGEIKERRKGYLTVSFLVDEVLEYLKSELGLLGVIKTE